MSVLLRINYDQLIAKSGGYYCGYCGKPLEKSKYGQHNKNCAVVDHIIPVIRGGSDDVSNLMLSCCSCNAMKRDYSLDNLRTKLAMRKFRERTGISFSAEQVEYLKSVNVDIGLEECYFRFEIVDSIMGGHLND